MTKYFRIIMHVINDYLCFRRLPSRASSAAGRVARRRNSLGLGQQLDPTAVPPSRASTAVGLLTKTVQWLNNDEGDEENEDDDDEEDDR